MSASDPCPVAFEHALAALEAEGRHLDEVLATLPVQWEHRPTRLPAWNAHELAAHLIRGVGRVREYLAQPQPDSPELDWLDYWRRARDLDPRPVAERAATAAQSLPPEDVPAAWREEWTEALAASRTAAAARVLPTVLAPMRLDHYLTSRVLEITVHGLDLQHALGLDEAPTPEGLAVTTALLDALLDGPRPDDLEGDVTFVLAATGRRSTSAPGMPVLR